MKLYFYRPEGDSLTCVEADARETAKLYISTGSSFPNFLHQIKKEQIGRVDDTWLILDRPDKPYARAFWAKRLTENAKFYHSRAVEFEKMSEKCRRETAALDDHAEG